MGLRMLLPMLMAAVASSAAQSAAFVHLQPHPTAAPGIAAFPRVLPGPGVSPGIAQKINAALTRQDAEVLTAAQACRQGFRDLQHKTRNDVWQRTVDVTMTGPRFLSYLAGDAYYCGNLYPNAGQLLPLVYDLTTGRPVDWLKLLPPGANGLKAVLDTAGDGSRVGVVVWPWLTARAASQADADCKSAFTEQADLEFALWLDGPGHQVVAQPFSFPHAQTACAEPIKIPAEEAHKLGFAKDLTDALQAAPPSH